MTLPKEVREEVVRLLKQGKVSKREIHRKTKVSRVTIDKIQSSLLFPKKEPPPPKKVPSKAAKPIFIICKGCGTKCLKDTFCLTCYANKKNKNIQTTDEWFWDMFGIPPVKTHPFQKEPNP